MIGHLVPRNVFRRSYSNLPKLASEGESDQILDYHLADPQGEIETAGDRIVQAVIQGDIQRDLGKVTTERH